MAQKGDDCRGKTPESRARQLANLEPLTSAVRHGGYRLLERGLAPPCDRCSFSEGCPEHEPGATCRVAERHAAEVAEELLALPHVKPEDRFLVAEFAKLSTLALVLDAYTATNGLFVVDEEHPNVLTPQPCVTRLRLAVSNNLRQLGETLGLTPLARARLERPTVADVVFVRHAEEREA